MQEFDEHFGDESYCDDASLIEMTAQSAPVRVRRRVRASRPRSVRAVRHRSRFAPDRQFFAPIALAREGWA
jgi:hypothetical protein